MPGKEFANFLVSEQLEQLQGNHFLEPFHEGDRLFPDVFSHFEVGQLLDILLLVAVCYPDLAAAGHQFSHSLLPHHLLFVSETKA